MPFPVNLEALYRAEYKFLRREPCSVCRESVGVFKTPGGRDIAIGTEPIFDLSSPVVRHYEICTPKEAQSGSRGSTVQDTAGRDSNSGDGNNAQRPIPPGGITARDHSQERIPDGRCDVGSIKLHGVTDPNHNLLAAGWAEGALRVRFSKGEGFHVGVPEDLFLKLKHSRFALRQYNLTIKDKFPYTEVE